MLVKLTLAISATMIAYNNSVILVGVDGPSEGVDANHLFQLTSPSGPWVEMRQTLKHERSRHVSFLVPDKIVNCHY